jgi:hypothetical protein
MPIKDGAGNKNENKNSIVFEFPETAYPSPPAEEQKEEITKLESFDI